MRQRLAIVTGGAGEIGRAVALRLAQDHDLVVLADHNLAAAKRVAAQLGPKFLPLEVDVTDEASCNAMAAEVAKLGSLLTVVNNAGAARGASLQTTSLDDWHADRALNLDAAFIVFKAVAPLLKAARGSVVSIASVNGLGVFGHPAYSVAKAGMIHLTRSIAVEYGKHGIRANAVAPGTVRTDAWQARATANPEVFNEATAHYALGHTVRPTDVAEAVGFLASPLASAITGVCLAVDCGLTAGVPALARTFSQSADY